MVGLLKRGISHLTPFTIAVGILFVTHLVGIIGFTTGWKSVFLSITPFHLLLVFALMVRFQENKDTSFYAFMLLVMGLSYLIELIGVQTGKIFGQYSYGSALGFKIGDTPLLIGILWFSLIHSIGMMLSKLKTYLVFKIFVGAGLMVLIDLFIEPVAIDLGFWAWENNAIPLQNYVAWYAISAGFLFMFYSFRFVKANKISPLVYWLQLLFFISINLI